MFDAIPCIHTVGKFDFKGIPQIPPVSMAIDPLIVPIVELNPYSHWILKKKDEMKQEEDHRNDDREFQIKELEENGTLQFRFIRLAYMCIKALPSRTNVSAINLANRLSQFYRQWLEFMSYDKPEEIRDETAAFARYSMVKLKAASMNDRKVIHLEQGE
jgi:hypothetical protein